MVYFIKLFLVIIFSCTAYGADKPLAQFESKRLTYCLLQPHHEELVVNLLTNPNVGKTYWTHGVKKKSWVKDRVLSDINFNNIYLMSDSLDDCKKFRWVIFEKDHFIGLAGINLKFSDGDFVIAVSPDYQGRGLGTEIEKTIVDQLFTHTAIQKIIHETGPDNWGSRRIAEKCGFTLQYEDNRYVPTVGYVLDRQKWRSQKDKFVA